MSKMRCKRCTNLNYDYLTGRYEPDRHLSVACMAA